jgi:hypothetical protein
MAKDITSIFKIGDYVKVLLNKPLTPHCMGSETSLSERLGDSEPVTSIMGKYVGARPGLIKINPIDGRVLDSPRDISRYVVIAQTQIKEAYIYDSPKKVFP